jgi:RND family efflux transporter MFP subunit
VRTQVVQAAAVGAAYVLDGVIEPVRQSTIAAQASGRIATLLVKAGDSVRSGQVLATIDDREASAGLQRSQAQVNQADAELRNAQANLVRTRDLQSKGFVSKAALDSATTQREAAQAQREQAVAGARQSGLSQSFTRITAPFDGRVLQTLAEAGDLAVPGKPLLTLFAPAPLRATVQVPASRAQAARGASQIVVMVDDGSGGLRAMTPVGRVATPSSDPVSQTTEWRLELAPADTANLLPGQQVRVRFTLPQADAATQLLVPQAAIVRRGELTAVYVVAHGAFSLRAVRLGADRGAEGVEVLAGIKSGDAVALDPNRAGFANAVPAAPTGK